MKLVLTGSDVNSAMEDWLKRHGFHAIEHDLILMDDETVQIEVELTEHEETCISALTS